ncbi:hypothetical protein FH729_05645 [Bacteroides thetaiotaomicron]|uniref:zinc ribbon domain-containing protein n=1 Tax=Bacteroides thetaiotaomicron TaxID=818 RepID=UPI00192916F3|nr:zinc ribbon domain-containing protein [Bacteroides thetaiotaomicron]MBL3917648.1 hypothetical protein [Bacteroides thetaiotaomicron]MBL3941855.1 hypothetical protein [Bacteroides thetaiotaomicron]MBL3946644.1 hypothetical protein [Bacteroides thetaiotaomicron]MBL3956912.1 hypothetical protein [Bacteroides thetaiotaomicron]
MFCKKCGTKQKVDEKFCAKCGTPYIEVNSNNDCDLHQTSNDINNIYKKLSVTTKKILYHKNTNRIHFEKDKNYHLKKYVFYVLMILCIFFGGYQFISNDTVSLEESFSKIGSNINIFSGGNSALLKKFNKSISNNYTVYNVPIYKKFVSIGYYMEYQEIDDEMLADVQASRNVGLAFYPQSETEGRATVIVCSIDFKYYSKNQCSVYRYRIEGNEVLLHSGTSLGSVKYTPDIRLKMSLASDGNIQLKGIYWEKERTFTKQSVKFDVSEWEYNY